MFTYRTPSTNWAAKFLKGNFRKTKQDLEENNNIIGSLKFGCSVREKKKVSSTLMNVITHMG